MRKPDPTRIVGRGKVKPDKLEMRGFSAPLSDRSITERESDKEKDQTGKRKATKQPSNRGTTTPRNHEIMVSRYHDTIIQLVRKAVKELGKEAATHRFTPQEKKAIAGIIYAYKSRGTRTSENEITRIAVNFIINDYKENGENSILDRALKALNE
jgi:hypothetical protein